MPSSRHFTFQLILIIHLSTLVILIYLVKQSPFFPIDLTISRAVQSIDFPGFNPLMRLMTELGFYFWEPASVIIVCLILWLLHLKKEIIAILISTPGSYLISETFKMLINRPRPIADLVKQIATPLTSPGFPSQHVLFFMSLYGFLLYLAYTKLKNGPLRTILISVFAAMIFLVALSRIYLGAHWFSDVLGGYLLGFIWLTIVVYYYRAAISVR